MEDLTDTQLRSYKMAATPKTANQVIDTAYKSTNTVAVGDNLNSTDGIKNAIIANARAIRLLADHVDGITTDETGARVDKSGKPVE